MQEALVYIRKELAAIYPATEAESLARLVLQHVKKYTHTQLLLARNEALNENEQQQVNEIVSRLKKDEPLQYILGETEFYGLKFYCKAGALIPRPETEELVDLIAREYAGQLPAILDLGTGTGCIPISLKKQLPLASVFGCDISETCLQLARENAALNEAPVSFFKLNMLEPEWPTELPPFDVLVSNPPYVCESEKKLMQANVLNYEPELALFVSDDDPLLFYRAIVSLAAKNLKSGGKLFWEINEALGKECCRLLETAGYQKVNLLKDINGKDRMISAQKL